MKILQNEVKCLKCGDQIYSAHRHDFKFCSCESIGVDGGMDYLKRVFNEDSEYEELSITIEDDVYDKTKEALIWARENNRNELGAICAIFRAFRDCGYELRKKDD